MDKLSSDTKFMGGIEDEIPEKSVPISLGGQKFDL